jgi:hypothetical protein
MKRLICSLITALVLAFVPVQLAPGLGITVARAETAASGLSVEEAIKMFKTMANQKDIAFHYVSDGCYARTHLMILRLKKLGAQPARVWAFPDDGGKLRAKTSFLKSGIVEWNYHVAPVVPVAFEGKTHYVVIDPSMFTRPVTVPEWSAAQKNSKGDAAPVIRITKLGEAPVLPNGKRAPGNGYWPVANPMEGATAHAISTMSKFKAPESRL